SILIHLPYQRRWGFFSEASRFKNLAARFSRFLPVYNAAYLLPHFRCQCVRWVFQNTNHPSAHERRKYRCHQSQILLKETHVIKEKNLLSDEYLQIDSVLCEFLISLVKALNVVVLDPTLHRQSLLIELHQTANMLPLFHPSTVLRINHKRCRLFHVAQNEKYAYTYLLLILKYLSLR